MATKKTETKTEAKATETKVAAKTTKAAAEKKTATATAEKKAPAKKAAAKTTKAAAEKKAPEKKAAAKAPAKKTTTTKKAAAATKVEVFVEFGGVQVSIDEMVKNIKLTNGKSAKEITVYLKPEESKAYFVADGEEKEMDVFFC